MGMGRRAFSLPVAVLAPIAFAAPAQAVEYLSGGDFEGGALIQEQEEGSAVVLEYIDHPSWQETDSQFESPICATFIPECGGSGRQPRGGQAWALFGAYAGTELHEATLSQTITLPEVEAASISFYLQVKEFEREASLTVKFDGVEVGRFEEDDLTPIVPGYQKVDVPIASGGRIGAGLHTVLLRYVSDPVLSAPSLTTLNVDDVSFTATPVPTVALPGPGAAVTPPPPDTKITKVQLYRAKAGKTGSAKRPGFLKATQGKTGKPAKAKFFFSGSGGAGGLHFECRLDDAALKSCDSPIFYKRLKLGPHTFKVFAVDRAGNKDPTPASYQWKAKAGKSGKTK